MSAPAHPWRLVAPWYRRERDFPGVAPRDTPPVIQKYETTKLVELFRDNPQHCLRFTGDDTVVDYSTGTPIDTGRRKLFLPAHKRFYLVACELHCDRPGLPAVARRDVCQAGFVIRRRRMSVPPEAGVAVAEVVQRVGKRRAQVATFERRLPIGPVQGPLSATHAPELLKRRVKAVQRLELERGRLAELMQTVGAREIVEGWVPGELDGVGSWEEVTATDALAARPEDGHTEDVFRLSPLIVPDGVAQHAGKGRTMYFGMLPAGNADHGPDGTPRFDDEHLYEVQCFVRRHRCGCPRRPNHAPDCHGPLTFSTASERFSFASHFDLVGTANRPVTIQLPDIPALLKQASSLEYGQGAPVRMKSPDGSSMQLQVDDDGDPLAAALIAGQICSFAIPLITIVATFVLRLFLPVVVLMFGLWALLRLKFCILPSLSVDAALSADLAAGASIDVGVDVALDARLEADLVASLGSTKAAAKMMATLPRSAIVAHLYETQQGVQGTPAVGAASGKPGAPGSASAGPNSALAPLIWETEVALP